MINLYWKDLLVTGQRYGLNVYRTSLKEVVVKEEGPLCSRISKVAVPARSKIR